MDLISLSDTPTAIEWSSTSGQSGTITRATAIATGVGGGGAFAVCESAAGAGSGVLPWVGDSLARRGAIVVRLSPAAVGAVVSAADLAGSLASSATKASVIALGVNDLHRVRTTGDPRDALVAAANAGHVLASAGAAASCADRLAAALSGLDDAPSSLAAYLLKAGEQAAVVRDAVWRAAAISRSREDFERMLALTECPAVSPIERTARGWLRLMQADRELPAEELTWGAYRRVLRAAYRSVWQATAEEVLVQRG